MSTPSTTLPSSDYLAAQTQAVSIDLSSQGDILEFSGDKAALFLNNYNTQDLKSLALGHAALGAFLTQKGKLVSDAFVLKLSNRVLALTEKGYAAKIAQHLQMYLDLSDIVCREVGDSWRHFVFLGPQAKERLETVLKQKLSDELGKIHAFSHEDASVLLFLSERWGVLAWELLAFLPEAELARQDFSFSIPPVSPDLLENFRVEAGLPKMGRDMNEEMLAAEVGLDVRATSFHKGCYLGQETTARVHSIGQVHKKITRFSLSQNYLGSLPVDLVQGEKNVGKLTSLVYSFDKQAYLGLGLVQSKALESPEAICLRDAPEVKVRVSS